MSYIISCDFGFGKDQSVMVIGKRTGNSLEIVEEIRYPQVDNDVHPEFTDKLAQAENKYQPHIRLNARQ